MEMQFFSDEGVLATVAVGSLVVAAPWYDLVVWFGVALDASWLLQQVM